MNKYKHLNFLFLLILLFPFSLSAYYYYEPFNTFDNTVWRTNVYWRDGYVMPSTVPPYTTTPSIVGGQLQWSGEPNNADGTLEGIYVGQCLTNRNLYKASSTNPFGVQIIRTYCFYTGPDNQEKRNYDSGLWLFRDKSISLWEHYGKYVLLSDICKGSATDRGQATWCYYDGNEYVFDLANAIRADGKTKIDLSKLNWDYNSGTAAAGTDRGNTNEIGLRITHNGSRINFYINPDPYENGYRYPATEGELPPYTGFTNFPNEYCLVGYCDVLWNTNLKFMFGNGISRRDKVITTRWDNVLIRSVASNIKCEIWPKEVTAGTSEIEFTYYIRAYFSPTDSGINVLTIEKPSIFDSDFKPSTVVVATNFVNLITITQGSPKKGEVLVEARNNILWIRFNCTNQIKTTNLISVKFTLNAPDRTDTSDNNEFIVRADGVHFNDDGIKTNFATTGEMKAVSGNAYSGCPSDTSIVRIYAQPKANTFITPNNINSDKSSETFIYTINNNDSSPDLPWITKLKILVPPQFSVTKGDVQSAKIGTNGVSVSSGTIIIDYGSQNDRIPPYGGVDYITIKAKPQITFGTYNFSAVVSNDIVGVINQTCSTSSGKSQSVTITPVSPSASAYILPNSIYTYDVINTFRYYIKNTGVDANKIKKAKIYYNNSIYNITAVTSSIISSSYITNGGTIILDYSANGTNLGPNITDEIKIVAENNAITARTDAWTSAVSNGHGIAPSFVSTSTSEGQKQSVSMIDVKAIAEAYISPNFIYTYDTTTSFSYYIKNNGSGLNKIKKAVIFVPNNIFTNLNNIQSSLIANDALYIKPALSGNISSITLDYSVEDSFLPGVVDTITFTAIDNAVRATNTFWPSIVDNGTGFVSTSTSIGQKQSVNITEQLASGMASISPQNIFTTLSDTTNDVTFNLVIINSGGAGNNIVNAKITFNTNIFKIYYIKSDAVGSNFTTSDASPNILIEFDYSSEPILPASQDRIVIKAKYCWTSPDTIPVFVYVKNSVSDYVPTSSTPKIYITTSTKGRISGTIHNPELGNILWYIYPLQSTNIVSFGSGASSTVPFQSDLLEAGNYQLKIIGDGYSTNKINATVYSNQTTSLGDIYPDLGAIKGIINPLTLSAVVRVYQAGTTNQKGITYTDGSTGNFRIKNLSPSITYDLQISGGDYSTNRQFRNISVSANSNTDLGLIYPDTGWIYGKILPIYEKAIVNAYISGSNISAGVGYSDGVTGKFEIRRLLPGNYDIFIDGTSVGEQFLGKRYKLNVSVKTNSGTDVGEIKLLYDPIDPYSAQARCYENNEICLFFPAGSLQEPLSIESSINVVLTDKQKEDIRVNKTIKNTDNFDGLVIIDFSIQDSSGNQLDEARFNKGVTIQVKYNYTQSQLQSRGWNEKDLALYYWDEKTSRWIKVGGKLDITSDTITASVQTLHKRYAILGSVELKKPIDFVKVIPNPFTPNSSDTHFNEVTISFQLLEPDNNVEVKIFNIKGEPIKTFKVDGSYLMGEVRWDGKDSNNNPVKGGVYIFQIISKKNIYSGSIILAK